MAQEKRKENKKYLNFLEGFPKWITVCLAVLFFVWGILDPALIQTKTGCDYAKETLYGLMGLRSFIGTMCIWWFIGLAICVSVYFFSSFSVSYKILHIRYLQGIKQSVDGVKSALLDIEVD